jgi:hypothetical protein
MLMLSFELSQHPQGFMVEPFLEKDGLYSLAQNSKLSRQNER